MARRWLDLSRSALQELTRVFVSRYKRLQPTPLEVGALLMLVMFPVGVWLNQRNDATSQYLSDYASGFFMLGLGLVLAYLYIDRFNERAQRQQYREVNGALVEAVINPVQGMVAYSFITLLKVPDERLEGPESDLLLSYANFFGEYFETDRRQGLEHFKSEFDKALKAKFQELDHFWEMGASHIVFTDQQAIDVVAACEHQIERMKAGMTRLVSARLKTRVLEDLLVIENSITDPFDSFKTLQAVYPEKDREDGKPKMSFLMWAKLHEIYEAASYFVIVLDGLLESTAFRERQRQGEHGHWTTTADERRME